MHDIDPCAIVLMSITLIMACHEMGDWLSSPERIKFIYSQTSGGSPLRNLVVQEFVDGFFEKVANWFAAEKHA